MSPILIAQLLAQFGPPALQLIDSLIAKISQKGDVSPEEWAAMRVNANQTSRDRMLLQLKNAGIDPESDKGKEFLALAS